MLPGQVIPADLIPKMLALVSSAEGFTVAEPDLQKSMWRLRRTFKPDNKSRKPPLIDKLVIGAIENTRHPKNLERTSRVLSTLGISVAPLRYHHYAGLTTDYGAYGEIPDDIYQSEQIEAARKALADSVRRGSLQFGRKWSSMIRPYDLDFVCSARNFASSDPTPLLYAAERLTALMVTNKSPWRLQWAESEIARRDGDWLKLYVTNSSNKHTEDIIHSGWTPVLLEDKSNTDQSGPGITQRRPGWESLARLSDASLEPKGDFGWELQTYCVESVDELTRWLSEEMKPKSLFLGSSVDSNASKALGDAHMKHNVSGWKTDDILRKVLEQRLKRRPAAQTKEMSKERMLGLLDTMMKRRSSRDTTPPQSSVANEMTPDVPAQEPTQEEDNALGGIIVTHKGEQT